MEQFIQTISEALKSNTVVVGPSNEKLTLFIFFVQWSAILLSTSAGLYAARKQGMDRYGALVVAFILAVGGGTIRDLLLGRYPIFWIAEPIYAFTVFFVFIVGLIFGLEKIQKNQKVIKAIDPVKHLAEGQSRSFLIIDSLALGLWAYLGSYYALLAGTPLIVAPIMGVITACFGGILRDVLFARVPQQLLPGQLYAIAAAIGATTYVILMWAGQGNTAAFLGCFLTTFLVRMLSVKYNIQSS